MAAALYRLAATLPGATLVRHATNVAGRAGIGIMWTSTSAKQVYKNEWIFDQTTTSTASGEVSTRKDPESETGSASGWSAASRHRVRLDTASLPERVTRAVQPEPFAHRPR